MDEIDETVEEVMEEAKQKGVVYRGNIKIEYIGTWDIDKELWNNE